LPTTEQLELQHVTVKYDRVVAAEDVSLTLADGEIGCLLGPSGCGKTTLLRAIAGFEPVAAGEIRLHDRVIGSPAGHMPPEARRVGMVFQDYALFPHLNVARNIAFGLEGEFRKTRRARVVEMLALVGLADYAGAYPHELSGGQQQRVALARALAPQPDILLLDEPFSSLDSGQRENLAGEVRTLLKRNGVTAILVTHDQHEAFAMADRISLMRSGRIVQTDTPYNLYYHPANAFVAEFIGDGRAIEAVIDADGRLVDGLGRLDSYRQPGRKLKLLVRPDDVIFDPRGTAHLKVVRRDFRGAHYLYELELQDGQRVSCLTPSHVDVAEGGTMPVQFDLRRAMVLVSE